MTLKIVRKIAEERDNSQLVPSKPRTELQRLRLTGIYELLVILRIILTLNLQTGWIHQDELSNSLEVVAGDYFDLQVFKPGAFNATFPTHSMALLHSTVYFPYLLCNYLLSYDHPVGKEKIPNTKLLILIPRLFYLLLSFLVDYLMVKFCSLNNPNEKKTTTDEEDEDNGTTEETKENKEKDACSTAANNLSENDASIRLVTLASSQVLLIFSTRTHPSSLNLVLFSTLLYLVSASFHAFDEYIPLLTKYNKLPKSEGVGRVRLLRKMKASGYSPINRLHSITFVTVCGIFNDPEFFLSYASIPLFFYMQRGISNRFVGMKYFHARIFMFLAYLFLFSVPFILWDSIHYGRLSWGDIKKLSLTPESFVITPVNYFASKKSVLRSFGGYAKILGMYLLVFNVLGIMGFVSFVKEGYDVLFAEWRLKPNMDSHWTFLNCSLFLPLFFLIQAHGNSYSVFDLSPLIFPLVYMHGHKIPLMSRFSSTIGLVWFSCNCLVGVLFFGYISQGGILSSFLDLYDNLTPIRFNETQVDITFSQMVQIPPTFTLAIPSKWKTILPPSTASIPKEELELDGLPAELHKTVLRLESSSKVRVYHTGHSPLPMSHLERDLHRLVHAQESGKEKGEKISFLIIPYTYGIESEESFRLLKLTHVKTYWNHVFLNLFHEEETDNGEIANQSFQAWLKYHLQNLISRNTLHFGLSLYRMEKVFKEKESEDEELEDKVKGRRANFTTKQEESFKKYFHFHDAFYDFAKYIGNAATLLLTCGLFLTSYLVYLT